MKAIKYKFKKHRVFKVLIILSIFFISLFLTLELEAPRIPLMGFHSVINIRNPEDRIFPNKAVQVMNYPREDLGKFIEGLINKNYWFITPQELYDYYIKKTKKIPNDYIGKRPIMLSFDDGYKTIATNLLPILERIAKKYGQKVKIVLFVNPGTLAGYEHNASIHLTCNDLRDGLKKGFYDIQSHGYSHKKLTDLKAGDLVVELYKAQTELRKCTQDLDPNKQVAAHIAYPFGASNKRVEEYASKYYLSGYLYNSQMFKIGWLGNNYRISRLTINRKKSPDRLIQMAERSEIIQ